MVGGSRVGSLGGSDSKGRMGGGGIVGGGRGIIGSIVGGEVIVRYCGSGSVCVSRDVCHSRMHRWIAVAQE
jgi:hypothetical protein